jgi:N-acetylmuramoyl-L-alanine amidase
MRPINKIIWHCSATKEGQAVSVETIRRWHLDRGFSDIGYHFVIGLDGVVRTGRPLEKAGAHAEGHNANSIGICYIGGVASDGKTPKDTRTPDQRAALYALTEDLLHRFPEATVHGHREFAAKACPSFDVQKDWASYLASKGGLSPDITPGLLPEDMRDEDFDDATTITDIAGLDDSE